MATDSSLDIATSAQAINRARWILVLACVSGALTVMLGAFAAHGLKAQLSPYLLGVFETGVQYQGMHSLALVGCGLWARILPSKAVLYAACFFAAGIVCFSGSLYALTLTGIKWFGPITPLGGFCFIFGWVALIVAAWRSAEGSK
ncbi:hypothetical protein A3K86_12485 [Photobacterium jeanii]|uniref:DUF423 domain-containing protein n=1 Tax=Photobacterium jeanii TaxID=858640 RepID=A0A178KBL5_9GAMM|nr:DUF423 domain-containing protein [Photobacterium jeanii]OAN14023.1 hypothetical protein A3K86_12485 [Photobacterium jeanii]PST86964.1 DUF423 domain-containing protein [Photobacterium jeanii]